MSTGKITVEEAVQTLSRAAGGAYVSIERHIDLWDGELSTEWLAWRGDLNTSYVSATMEGALTDALKGR